MSSLPSPSISISLPRPFIVPPGEFPAFADRKFQVKAVSHYVFDSGAFAYWGPEAGLASWIVRRLGRSSLWAGSHVAARSVDLAVIATVLEGGLVEPFHG